MCFPLFIYVNEDHLIDGGIIFYEGSLFNYKFLKNLIIE